MSPTAKEQLIKSATCTAVFAVLYGLIVSCGGGGSLLNRITPSSSSTARILSSLSPTTAALPQSSSRAPLLAAMVFQSSQSASTIQQSFQGVSCDASFNASAVPQPGSKVNWSGSTTGFIPIHVLGDPWIILPNSIVPGGISFYPVCDGVFAQVGGGTSLLPSVGPGGEPGVGAGTLANPGTAIYADGTLSTLIVIGASLAGKQIRCSDLTHTAAVHDSDLVQPYFVIGTNAVVLAIGGTQLPLTCTLNIDQGDQAGSISVQWAKI